MSNPDRTTGLSPEYVPDEKLPFWKLQDLALRNSTAITQAMEAGEFDPYSEFKLAQDEFRPWKSSDEGFEDPRPRIFLIARESQDQAYFLGKPYHPKWELTPDFLQRALRTQRATKGNRLARHTYDKVFRMDGSASDAEICGIVFTEFFTTPPIDQENENAESTSDWELIARFISPKSPIDDHERPEVFTFRTLLNQARDQWTFVHSERNLRALPREQKNQFAEDIIGQGLKGVAREASSRNVRQVAARLLGLHPYDPTHEMDGNSDRVSYHISESPEYALAEEYLWSQELAEQLIPDNSTPVYLPNYGRQTYNLRGTLYIREKWLSKTLSYHPVNALAELIYAASLARDDSFGRLRGVIIPPMMLGMEKLPRPIANFPIAIERALMHTELFLRDVLEWDKRVHGIHITLEGISKRAHDKYSRDERLENHPYLYDDPPDRTPRPPRPGRDPDDEIGSLPKSDPFDYQNRSIV